MGAQSAHAAAIYTESFEFGLQANTVINNGGSGKSGDFWSVLPTGSLNIGYTVGGIDGASYFGFRDIDGSFGGGNDPSDPRTLEIQGLDISLYTNVKLIIGLSSRKDGSTNCEATDILNIKADSGAGLATLDSFFGSGSSGPLNTGLKNGAGTELTTTLTDFIYDIDPGSLLSLRIDASPFNGNNEAVAIDNIRITGDLIDPAAVPEPGTLTLFGFGLAGLGLARHRRTV